LTINLVVLPSFMENIMEKRIKNYFLERLDSFAVWVGIICLLLWLLNLGSFLFIFFLALIFVPEGHFTEVFKKWTKELRDLDGKTK